MPVGVWLLTTPTYSYYESMRGIEYTERKWLRLADLLISRKSKERNNSKSERKRNQTVSVADRFAKLDVQGDQGVGRLPSRKSRSDKPDRGWSWGMRLPLCASSTKVRPRSVCWWANNRGWVRKRLNLHSRYIMPSRICTHVFSPGYVTYKEGRVDGLLKSLLTTPCHTSNNQNKIGP